MNLISIMDWILIFCLLNLTIIVINIFVLYHKYIMSMNTYMEMTRYAAYRHKVDRQYRLPGIIFSSICIVILSYKLLI